MTNVYIYQAALYCEDCGEAICAKMATPTEPDNESSYDSDDYPKGPYGDGGGEADSPQHCDSCGAFLENALTRDGVAYVREAIADASGNADVLATWAEFYRWELVP